GIGSIRGDRHIPARTSCRLRRKRDRKRCALRSVEREWRSDPAQLEAGAAHRGLRNVDRGCAVIGQRDCLAALAPHRYAAKTLARRTECDLTAGHSGSCKRERSGATVRGVPHNGNRGIETPRRIGTKNETDRGALASKNCHRQTWCTQREILGGD